MNLSIIIIITIFLIKLINIDYPPFLYSNNNKLIYNIVNNNIPLNIRNIGENNDASNIVFILTYYINNDSNVLKVLGDDYIVPNNQTLTIYINHTIISQIYGSNNNNINPYIIINDTFTDEIDIEIEIKGEINNLNNLFKNCKELKTVEILYDTYTNLSSTYSMFNNCTNIIYINLNKIYAYNIYNISYMFSDCHNLTYVDIGNLNIVNNNISYENMFMNCNLQILYISDTFLDMIKNHYTDLIYSNNITFYNEKFIPLSCEQYYNLNKGICVKESIFKTYKKLFIIFLILFIICVIFTVIGLIMFIRKRINKAKNVEIIACNKIGLDQSNNEDKKQPAYNDSNSIILTNK